MLGAERLELGSSRHLAIIAHDLADDRCRFEPGQASEIDRTFGLPRPHEHAALAAAQRVDVPGTEQILRLRVLSDCDFDGLRAVARAHAGRDAETFMSVDGDGERGAKLRGVALHLRMKLET